MTDPAHTPSEARGLLYARVGAGLHIAAAIALVLAVNADLRASHHTPPAIVIVFPIIGLAVLALLGAAVGLTRRRRWGYVFAMVIDGAGMFLGVMAPPYGLACLVLFVLSVMAWRGRPRPPTRDRYRCQHTR